MAALRARLLAAALAAPPAAWCAGGHHAVDDAVVLEPGQCELELWHGGQPGTAASRLSHAGPACRVGPVELGLSRDQGHRPEDGTSIVNGAQLKWVTGIAGGLSAGVAAIGTWSHHPHATHVATGLALLTWQPSPALQLHANLGRDWVAPRNGVAATRAGVSADWSVGARWVLTAERYRQQGAHFARAGMRLVLDEQWTVDLSRTRPLGSAPGAWIAGLTWTGSVTGR